MTGRPDVRKILAFICEEVERQGYNLMTQIGLDRVEGMLNAWQEAIDIEGRKPWKSVGSLPLSTIKALGQQIEPGKNPSGFRTMPLVFPPDAAPPEKIHGLMSQWVEECFTKDPDQAYLEFQKIHPFADGNGRVGKILHNWLKGTLENPVLVQDYFGAGVP